MRRKRTLYTFLAALTLILAWQHFSHRYAIGTLLTSHSLATSRTGASPTSTPAMTSTASLPTTASPSAPCSSPTSDPHRTLVAGAPPDPTIARYPIPAACPCTSILYVLGLLHDPRHAATATYSRHLLPLPLPPPPASHPPPPAPNAATNAPRRYDSYDHPENAYSPLSPDPVAAPARPRSLS